METRLSSMSQVPRRPALHEEIRRPNTFQRRAFIIIATLVVLLLRYRLRTLSSGAGLTGDVVKFRLRLVATLCEGWFAFIWLLAINTKWTRVDRKTYPQGLLQWIGSDSEFPPIDVFVTTADPSMEPPIITINTVLSILAVDYPPEKLACYVSDDGCSPVTLYSLMEASEFAKIWIPFCKKHEIQIRAPFMYFSCTQKEIQSNPKDFVQEWKEMKCRYEELSKKIAMQMMQQHSVQLEHPQVLPEFAGAKRGDHGSVIKIVHGNEGCGEHNVPHLIYVSREKRPTSSHHYKAGAMNVLTRVSGLMTKAPFMLNVDCDMFVNNPKVMHHALCLLLGFETELECGFVQFPQKFYGGLMDDPYGNQLTVVYQKGDKTTAKANCSTHCPILRAGCESWNGVNTRADVCRGTGCFHRRKVIYGLPPSEFRRGHELSLQLTDDSGYQCERKAEKLESIFGKSKPFIESAFRAFSCQNLSESVMGSKGLEASVEDAIQVSGCTYESNNSWGSEVGWLYGSTVEDVMTGLKIHAMGWRTVGCWPEPPAFLGCAPSNVMDSLVQQKRWSTGFLEVLVCRLSPIYASLTGKLEIRQCLVYLTFCTWALRAVPEFCYSLLPAFCIFTGNSIYPKVFEPQCLLPIGIFIIYNLYTLGEYRICRLSVREWWNNQRMARIITATAWLFGFFSVILKVLGISETVFEVTRKDDIQESSRREHDVKFAFNSSPILIPATALLLVNLAGLVIGVGRVLIEGEVVQIIELLCCAWLVTNFFTFLKGLFRSGCYGIPWSTFFKSGCVAFLFFCSSKWFSH